jgi:2-phosphosulfolactate phosphatase
MKLCFATLGNCADATDAVVVIDVIRAFTTAAFTFAAGAQEIFPVATVEEAWTLRRQFPTALLMGEVGGLPPAGFDLGNSPAALVNADLRGRRIIQRTGAGTQGIVRCARADFLLAASFVCAQATARLIQEVSPATVTLVSTSDQGEDAACAEYLAALLRNETPARAGLLRRAQEGGEQHIHEAMAAGHVSADELTHFKADLDCCIALDRFDFAMRVQRRDGLLVMEAVRSLR